MLCYQIHKLDQGALGIVGYIRIASFIRKHKFCSILFLSTLDLAKILEKTRVPLLKKVKTSFSLCFQEFYWCSFQYRKSKQTPKKIYYNKSILCAFLGRFRTFENRPLDPVFYFLSKCEKSKLVKSKKLKNCLERSKLTTNAQLGSAPLSLTQLSLAWLGSA